MVGMTQVQRTSIGVDLFLPVVVADLFFVGFQPGVIRSAIITDVEGAFLFVFGFVVVDGLLVGK